MAGRVLVAGGTGFVGREVVATLERLNYEVIVVSRTGKTGPGRSTWGSFLFRSKGEVLPQNRISWSELENRGLPAGTVAVVNAAGQNVLDPFRRWNPAFQRDVYESRVNTNKMLAKAVSEAEVKPLALVTMSGVGFYPAGGEEGEGMTEDSPGGSHNFLARLVVDWEAAAMLPPEVNTRVVRIRSGVVLGRQGGMIQQLFLPFYLGLGGIMGRGSQVMPWIHVKDVARLVVHSIQSSHCEGVYNAVAPQVTTNRQFVKTFARNLWRPAIFPTPAFVFNLVFGPERAAMITDSQVVRPRRTLESGFEFHYPNVDEACQEFSHLFYTDPDSS